MSCMRLISYCAATGLAGLTRNWRATSLRTYIHQCRLCTGSRAPLSVRAEARPTRTHFVLLRKRRLSRITPLRAESRHSADRLTSEFGRLLPGRFRTCTADKLPFVHSYPAFLD